MTSLDIETIEHLDFDFEPPCEAEGYPWEKEKICNGSNVAEWRIKKVCCQTIHLYCDHCLNYKIDDNVYMLCSVHQITFDPPRTAYEFIERIK